jgi:hypothetical protein
MLNPKHVEKYMQAYLWLDTLKNCKYYLSVYVLFQQWNMHVEKNEVQSNFIRWAEEILFVEWKVLLCLIIFFYLMTSIKPLKFQWKSMLPTGNSSLIYCRKNYCIVNNFCSLGASSLEIYGNPVWRVTIYHHHLQYSTTINIDLRFSQWWLWRVVTSGIERCVVLWKSPYISEERVVYTA